ncbi:hypothetical protein [Mycobacterium sp. MS1601]|uniref:hypothetical protein n=1 Tax=Mycobacterium sp. MS1601 TaxID=1936029 RepID=UPI001F231FFA|nr:hypothetical protein [Mycobacterium sp. MS1601]
MAEWLACKVVGLARSTCRSLLLARTAADPDAEIRGWLRTYATNTLPRASERAWASLRYCKGREVARKEIHRLWREEGLQVRMHSPRKRAGVSPIPPVDAGTPNAVRAISFQFDSTIDGKAIKIAPMVAKHSRCLPLNIVERSITADRLVDEFEKVFAAAGGPPRVLRRTMDRSSFLKHCNSSVVAEWVAPTSRRGSRVATDTSNPSTIEYAESVSTATTGTPCSRLAR